MAQTPTIKEPLKQTFARHHLNRNQKLKMNHINKLPDSDRVITEGHVYELENFENKTASGQILKFIEKQPKNGGSLGELETVMDGTTNEEVLKALIHRCGCLAAKFPSRETAIAITNMEQALMWLEKRTRDRLARNVEGKALA